MSNKTRSSNSLSDFYTIVDLKISPDLHFLKFLRLNVLKIGKRTVSSLCIDIVRNKDFATSPGPHKTVWGQGTAFNISENAVDTYSNDFIAEPLTE